MSSANPLFTRLWGLSLAVGGLSLIFGVPAVGLPALLSAAALVIMAEGPMPIREWLAGAALDPDVLKWIALAFMGLVMLVFAGLLFAFFPIFVFIVMGLVAALALRFADEDLNPKWAALLFILFLVFGLVVVYR